MRRLMTLIALAGGASVALAAADVHDPFDYPQGSSLGGQGPTTEPIWTKGSSGNDATIGSESLPIAGLPPSAGLSVNLSGLNTSNAVVDRIALSGGGGAVTTGTVYYSLALKVTDMTGLSTALTGVFVAGFNNSAATATNGVTRAVARLQMRTSTNDPSKFQLGVRSDNSSTLHSEIAWDTARDFQPDEIVFVVAAYEFNKTADPDPGSDDVSMIWINPDSATRGAETAPPPDLASTGSDISQLQVLSFFLRQVDVGPTATVVDELRIGRTWADVTSAVIPPPPCNEPRFDSNGDEAVDMLDFAVFQRCISSGIVGPIHDLEVCRCMNSDGNTVIDAVDLVAFSRCGSGPAVPADPACDDDLPPP